MANWKQALTRAINAEMAAEKAATVAEEERRQTWWATTWALAVVPRAEWGEAADLYVTQVTKVGGKAPSKVTAEKRRRVGTRLSEETVAGDGLGLPLPTLAMEASDALGAKTDPTLLLAKIREAEADGLSKRELRVLFGGKVENMPLTEAEEDAVVEKVARTRPKRIASTVADPQVAKEVVENKAATKSVIQQGSARTRRIIKRRKDEANANAAASAQTDEVVEAGKAAMAGLGSASPGYNAINSAKAEAWKRWLQGIKDGSFTPFDRHLFGSDLASWQRLIAEMVAFVEAEDDPYEAVRQHRVERREEFDRLHDEAEADVDIDQGLEDIERYVNESSG